jgi:hypothetical protein
MLGIDRGNVWAEITNDKCVKSNRIKDTTAFGHCSVSAKQQGWWTGKVRPHYYHTRPCNQFERQGFFLGTLCCTTPFPQRSLLLWESGNRSYAPALLEKVRSTTRLLCVWTHLILEGSELNSMYASSRTTSTGSANMARI